MFIQNENVNRLQLFTPQSMKNNEVENKNSKNFGSILQDTINYMNDSQIQSQIATQKLINKENIELHDVMIAAQKATITMQLALEVRNKVVEAYQEIMRMQV